MVTLNLVLHVAAVVCFVLATFNVSSPRANLIAAGLACFAAAALV
jgi:hypothetical protein